MRRFYKHTLCILENFRLPNQHLHPGLLASVSERVSERTWSDGMTMPIDEIASFECNIAGVRNCPYLSGHGIAGMPLAK